MDESISKNLMIEFLETFKKYQDIIDILLDFQCKDGLCRIPQQEIAKKLGISQTLVSKCLIRLEKFDKCVEKVSPGCYRVHHTNILQYGPLRKVMEFCAAAYDNEGMYSMKYERQAETLGMTYDEIKMIHGYLSKFYNV